MVAAALRSRLDHVAIAVRDVDRALAYWGDTVGGGLVAREINPTFHSAQVRYDGGRKLELLAPPPGAEGGGFVGRFLERFGAAIHHVTVMVPDLGEALDTVRAGGYDIVDVQTTAPHWREGFLRPSQVGGLIVQVAWTPDDDAAWARRYGVVPQQPAPAAPRLLGLALAHPDLAQARALWSLLGARVDGDDRLVCRWPDSPLDVTIERGRTAGPLALRFAGAVPSAPASMATPAVRAG
jgi:methylmalonyl-CoA/ethylmalonyl-CoA epimerase